jgi:arsenite methyltransferase
MTPSQNESLDVLDSVRSRYGEGARSQVPELCCPVDYDASLLEVLPPEIIERDYGCGDPSRFVRPGEVVLDLGSGAGKICFMASQLVGAEGRVIGIDTTQEMLALSRAHREPIGARIGWVNTEFRHGLIQDLALDRDRLDLWLAEHPICSSADLEALRAEEQRLRREEPLVADNSIDLVLSNCVLNLVDSNEKGRMFAEIHRVLKPGGRCAISDIVSDEDVPLEMQNDPELWSGCISGAMREDRFLEAFAEAGLHGIKIVELASEPWAVVQSVEFRSMTVCAWKDGSGEHLDQLDALIYKGPWQEVRDESGQVLKRGERTAVSRHTFERLGREPYAAQIHPVPPLTAVSADDAQPRACCAPTRRDPKETKAGAQRPDHAPGSGGSCC